MCKSDIFFFIACVSRLILVLFGESLAIAYVLENYEWYMVVIIVLLFFSLDSFALALFTL